MVGAEIATSTVTRKAIPGPMSQIEVKFRAKFTGVDPQRGIAIPFWNPEVKLAGIPLPVTGVSSLDTTGVGGDWFSPELSFRILLPADLIRLVDAARTGDLAGSIEVWFHYVEGQQVPGGGVVVKGYGNAPTIPFDFSRDGWAKLLGELGWDASWVVEIPSPTIGDPAWEPVVKHLEVARKQLRDFNAPAAAQSCRDAWQAASPLLVGRWEEVRATMLRGSKNPAPYTSKAERVASVYDDVSNLLNDARFLADTSKHGEAHVVTGEDALLIYRMTHSLIGYLARQNLNAQVAAAPK
jgi:hypothetical protein